MLEVGANVVRNTMSQREGIDLKPHLRIGEMKFDLDKWNPEYWQRFENFLKWCDERDIVIQIEVWDRFDFSRDLWEHSPWRPINNVNYTADEVGFKNVYGQHPSRDVQPFFHSVPGMKMYTKKLELIRDYQEKFVDKMLSYSLGYSNVLYCMNNETSTPVEWGRYWMAFIRKRAAEARVEVMVADMFDDGWKPRQSEKFQVAFENPEIYSFIDVSQVNSRTFNEDHWDNVIWLAKENERRNTRPLNNTKIYSDGEFSFGTGLPVDGVERFWRNLIAGCASVRYHRPPAGIGLNDVAKACIRAGRKATGVTPLWGMKARLDLLSGREKDEAYLAAKEGERYLLYFTDGGEVGLDLSVVKGEMRLLWVDVSTGEWGGEERVKGGGVVEVKAPGEMGWVGVMVR
jgi:hypothetical protein